MAPQKSKTQADALKQKSLMSWFGQTASANRTTAQTNANPKSTAPTEIASRQSRPQEPKTPEPKGQEDDASHSRNMKFTVANSPAAFSSKSSDDAGLSALETPPTSDPVDVDMLSAEEEEGKSVSIRPTHGKRKIVIDDSDDDIRIVSSNRTRSNYRTSSPARGRAKKSKVELYHSDEDSEGGMEGATDTSLASFTKRLTQFRKPPSKSSRKAGSNASSNGGDDDEFIIPSDSEFDDLKSTTSRRQRSSSRSSHLTTSSRRSRDGEFAELGSDFDDDEVGADQPKSSKTKKSVSAKKSSATTTKGAGDGVSAPGGVSFLTAAEQRAQDKKSEKKSSGPFAFLKDPEDKDKNRPGDPNYDPRTLLIPEESWIVFTPFEKQFWEIKQNHYDTVLFFQKGKFLELYEEDAWIGHREFDLKITQRVKMSMVGVPEMSFNFWAAKFLAKGYKVGRVDQAETALGAEMRLAAAKSKGKVSEDKGKEKIVRRELNKVYTNGTLIDAELLTDDQAGHCISICEERQADGSDENNTFGICVLDCSTSQFNLSAFEDDVCRTKLETLMRQLRPKELLFTKGSLSVSTSRLLKIILPPACLWTGLREVEGFGYDQTIEQLNQLYPVEEEAMNDDELLNENVPSSIREMVGHKSAIKALGSMIWYLRQLNIDKEILSMKNFNVYHPMQRGQGLTLDGQALAHIEVLLNNEGSEEGSLLKLLSRCITPFGKRLFRIWLCMPLREVSDINARLDAVQDLLNHPTFENDFNGVAKGLPDLERIVSRIHGKNCKVKDFLKMLTSFTKLSTGLSQLADSSEGFESKTILGLLRSAPDLLPNIKNVQRMYESPSSEKDTDELVPREGMDEEYDAIVSEMRELEETLEKELKTLTKKLGCPLSYWHSAQGNKEIYLVQSKADCKVIPKNWTKSGSTKANSRWLVPSLQSTIRSLKEARENRNTAIKKFKYRLFEEFDKDRSVWLRAIRVLAELDCLFSLAKSSNAIGDPACRPEIVEGDSAFVDFEELRHPTLDLRNGHFIPNDVQLGGDMGKIALLTGPNMAGKSTVMRMTAVGVIMAQLGMLVPAKRARLCPVDAILTRMGAYDNMFSNSSTFKVELDECCKILREATPKSLVMLDELGRGTSTFDGMAIAGAVLHQLATHTLSLAFFATHYGSLTDDFAYHPNIRNMHMSTLVDDEKRDLVFLFKLVEGVARSSFGTHVANLAGVPQEVVERAEVVSRDFAQQFKERMEDRKKKSASSRLPLVAQADFAYLYGLATGKFGLAENAVRQREVLMRLKETVCRYVRLEK